MNICLNALCRFNTFSSSSALISVCSHDIIADVYHEEGVDVSQTDLSITEPSRSSADHDSLHSVQHRIILQALSGRVSKKGVLKACI